jgi:hypothetical protein
MLVMQINSAIAVDVRFLVTERGSLSACSVGFCSCSSISVPCKLHCNAQRTVESILTLVATHHQYSK